MSEPKDFIAIAISVLALLVAAATAYLTLILQTDAVDAFVEGVSKYSWNKGTDSIDVDPDFRIFFMNSGNRTSVADALIEYHSKNGRDEKMTCSGDIAHFALRDSSILKPGDIALRRGSEFEGSQTLPRKIWDGTQKTITVVVCISFRVITTDGIRQVKEFEVERQYFDVGSGLPQLPRFADRNDQPAFKIIRRHQFHFG